MKSLHILLLAIIVSVTGLSGAAYALENGTDCILCHCENLSNTHHLVDQLNPGINCYTCHDDIINMPDLSDCMICHAEDANPVNSDYLADRHHLLEYGCFSCHDLEWADDHYQFTFIENGCEPEHVFTNLGTSTPSYQSDSAMLTLSNNSKGKPTIVETVCLNSQGQERYSQEHYLLPDSSKTYNVMQYCTYTDNGVAVKKETKLVSAKMERSYTFYNSQNTHVDSAEVYNGLDKSQTHVFPDVEDLGSWVSNIEIFNPNETTTQVILTGSVKTGTVYDKRSATHYVAPGAKITLRPHDISAGWTDFRGTVKLAAQAPVFALVKTTHVTDEAKLITVNAKPELRHVFPKQFDKNGFETSLAIVGAGSADVTISFLDATSGETLYNNTIDLNEDEHFSQRISEMWDPNLKGTVVVESTTPVSAIMKYKYHYNTSTVAGTVYNNVEVGSELVIENMRDQVDGWYPSLSVSWPCLEAGTCLDTNGLPLTGQDITFRLVDHNGNETIATESIIPNGRVNFWTYGANNNSPFAGKVYVSAESPVAAVLSANQKDPYSNKVDAITIESASKL